MHHGDLKERYFNSPVFSPLCSFYLLTVTYLLYTHRVVLEWRFCNACICAFLPTQKHLKIRTKEKKNLRAREEVITSFKFQNS